MSEVTYVDLSHHNKITYILFLFLYERKREIGVTVVPR